MIELRHITKRFGPLTALDDVSVTVAPGCILGLLGENGAGKSTLMQVLFGLMRPEAGEIVVGGKVVRVHSPRAAHKLGIGMVHQHFKLVPTLTGLENLRLFVRGTAGELRGRAGGLLARLRWQVPLEEPVENLAVGQQQRIEIAKALLAMESARGRVGTLILDEPTAVLTPQETGELFAALKALRDGGTAIVFISHKLGEVTQICDHLAILRRGRLVHAGPGGAVGAGGISVEEMAEKMVGSRVEMPRLARSSAPVPQTVREAVLTVQGVSTSQLRRVSLAVRGGEILGIAGVDGNGQTHLAQVILGTRTAEAGEVLIGQRPAGTLRQRLEAIAFIAEDRQREALVLGLSVEDNLLLKDYRGARFSTLGWLRLAAWRRHAETLMRQFDVRAGSATATVGQLSGGNQQKVVLARELFTEAAGETAAGSGAGAAGGKRIVVAVNPTRGLDVGATAFVLQKLLEARARGAAILLIHSDLDELLAVADRVAVLFNGTLTEAPEMAKETIGRLMLGLNAVPPPRPQPRGNVGGAMGGGA